MAESFLSFDILRGEKKLVLSFFFLSVFIGLAQFMTLTVSTARFLEVYSASDLPYIYLYSAVLIIFLGTILTIVQKRWKPETVLPFVLLILLITSVSLFLINLFNIFGPVSRVVLQVWADAEFIFCDLVFWQAASRIFRIRQAKRLYGLIGAGAVISAFVLGGILFVFLRFFQPVYLLGFSVAGLAGALFTLQMIFSRFLRKTAEEADFPEEPVHEGLTSAKTIYISFIFVLVFVEFFSHFFLDNIFYINAERILPNTGTMVLFLGLFSAGAAVFKILTKTFVTGKLLQKKGIAAGLFLPVSILLFFFILYIAVNNFFPLPFLVFAVIVCTKFFETSFITSIYAPAYYTLYQPFHSLSRGRIQNIADLVVGQSAGILAGGALIFLHRQFETPFPISLSLLVLLALWCCLTLLIQGKYTRILSERLSDSAALTPEMLFSAPRTQALLSNFTSSPVPEERKFAEQRLALLSAPKKKEAEKLPAPEILNKPLEFEKYLEYSEKDFTVFQKEIQKLNTVQTEGTAELLITLLENAESSTHIPVLRVLGRMKSVLTQEQKKRIHSSIDREIQRNFALNKSLVLLSIMTEDEFLQEAFSREKEKSEERAFLLLGLLYNRDTVLKVYSGSRSSDPEMRQYAAELLESIASDEHKAVFISLTEAANEHEALEMLSKTVNAKDLTSPVHMDKNQLAFASESLHSRWINTCIINYEGATDTDSHLIEKVRLLSNTPIFQDVPNADLSELAKQVEPETIGPGTRIIQKDEYGSSMYITAAGTVKVHNKDREIAAIGPGSIFGELSALSPEKRSASISAVTEVRLLEIKGDDLSRFLASHGSAGFGVLQTIAERVRSSVGNNKGKEITRKYGRGNTGAKLRKKPKKLEILVLLQSFPIAAGLTLEAQTELAALLEPVQFRKKEKIYETGDADTSLYFLASGKVVVRACGQMPSVYTDRSMFGLLSAIDSYQREGTAEAEEKSLCLKIRQYRLEGFLKTHYESLEALLEILISRLRELVR
ncbi:MAG: cyclic nucleotide-binding domain-containing protein [Spirochaetia bacterium]